MSNIYIQEMYMNKSENAMIGESEVYETWTNDIGQLFRSLQQEFGRCVSSMFIDKKDGTTKKIGWVFLKREGYTDAPHVTYLKETWVSIHEKPSKTHVTYHYANLA